MQNLDATTAPLIFALAPESVTPNVSSNGRFAAPRQDFIRELALDILTHSSRDEVTGELVSGQQAPIGVSPPDEDGQRGMKYGYRRFLAIELINAAGDEGKNADEAAKASQAAILAELQRLEISPESLDDGSFTFPVLACESKSNDPLSDLDVNVSENGARDPMSDMDWATVCAHYRTQGLTASQIADRLSRFRPTRNEKPSASWVMQHLEMLEAAPEVQIKVHQGELSVWAALQILRNAKGAATPDATPAETLEAQRQALSGMIGEDGKVDKKRAREINRVNSGERGAKTTKTISELRQVCSRLAAGGSRRAKLLGAWIEGEVSTARLEALLQDGAEAPEEKPKKGTKQEKPAKGAKKDEKPAKGGKGAKKDEKPAVDEKTGARLPAKKKPTRATKPGKASPAVDVVDPDEIPELGAAPQGEAEMSAEEADALLHNDGGEAEEEADCAPVDSNNGE